MVVELIGGPLDGAVIDGRDKMPHYVVLSTHEEGPIYRAGCCTSCGVKRDRMPYFFLGYEQNIKYEYAEKSQDIQAIEQENNSVSDSSTGN